MQNFLTLNNFGITIPNHPLLEKMAIRASIPSVSIEPATHNVPKYGNTPQIADSFTFSPLSVSFAVDEKLELYNDILMWAEALIKGEPLKEDINLMLYDSNKRPTATIIFESAFPRDFDGMSLDLEGDPARAILDVSFAFTKMRLL